MMAAVEVWDIHTVIKNSFLMTVGHATHHRCHRHHRNWKLQTAAVPKAHPLMIRMYSTASKTNLVGNIQQH